MNAGTLDALHAFLAMGGYAGYVWGSLGMCALAFALEVAWLRAQRRQARRQAALPDAAPAPAVRRPVVTHARGPLVAEERP